MSVLVFAETIKGKFKKATFEAVTYGRKLADALSTDCIALCLGDVTGAEDLGIYGASKILNVKDDALNHFDSQIYTSVIAQVAGQTSSDVIVLSHSANGKSLIGRLSVKMNAGSVSGVNALPNVDGSFSVSKGVFSGKAFATYEIITAQKVISLMGNSFGVQELGSAGTVETISADVPASRLTVTEVQVSEGTVPLPEAELVVSAGRGMKGPENWGIIEEMADILGATTACSRPVADSDWRPHHEHVGQTGIAIRPNLYIAIGISGAIQHLAGVNNSKVIVVINKDPEAPFFKAATYGIVGDLFDVVPRLNDALRKFKAEA
ncbi:electron transfer flavoprotein subunit alpha/FixB family protein [Portibacter lacus]|uniref:Electron transfer flavoprotein subunit alpha n=1 Tax=Portibacter lacus TaxID=1099794 RepID=A0AA37WBR8_9BACT|nr:electron transfer flavoprotein subunit alpha/FixB family protein [Portibacter lacus]GLR15701.1 electron transfer flavoprotein subunit alpha [Portibacter lacus]